MFCVGIPWTVVIRVKRKPYRTCQNIVLDYIYMREINKPITNTIIVLKTIKYYVLHSYRAPLPNVIIPI